MKQALRCGDFFGNPSRSYESGGISLSHRIATGDVEPHVHDDAHLVWVTGGHYVSSAAGEADNTAVLIFNPAGTSHRDRFVDRRGSFFTISLRKVLLERWRDLPSTPHHVADPRARGFVFELLEEFWEEPDSALLVEALCAELIDALAGRDREHKPPQWLVCAREVLHERATENLSLADAAGELGVHPVHFTRAFRKYFGCTPGAWLRACRLRRAADLLRGSRLGVSELALAAGFSDQSHFTHRFTRHFGVAPAAYRRLTA